MRVLTPCQIHTEQLNATRPQKGGRGLPEHQQIVVKINFKHLRIFKQNAQYETVFHQ